MSLHHSTALRSLAPADFASLVDISQAIADQEDRVTLMNTALEMIEGELESTSSVYFGIRQQAGELGFNETYSHGVPHSGPTLWHERYKQHDPFVDHMMSNVALQAPPVAISSDLVHHRDYVRSDFYNLFLKPQSIYHVLVVGLVQSGIPLGLFGFHRPYGAPAFSQREIAKMSVLAPAMVSAIGRTRAESALQEREWILNNLAADIPYQGVMIVDEEMQVHYANDSAKDVLGLRNGNPLKNQQIASACERLLNQGGVKTEVTQGDLSVRVHSIQHESGQLRYAVYLGPEHPDVLGRDKMNAHGLTAREVQVVELVARGMTNPQVAESMHISKRTVQNHLRSVYAKVGVHNRTSLLYRLATLDP